MGAVSLFLRGDLTTTTIEMEKYSCLIGKHGDKFHVNVQTAFDAGKACMLFMESRPDIMCNDVMLNPDGWEIKKGVSDDLDQAMLDIFTGGWLKTGRRAIHGIMVDISKHEDLSGKKLSAEWFAGYSEWLVNTLNKATGLPVWVYIGQGIINEYQGEQVYTGNDLITIQTCFAQKLKNISTVTWGSENGLPVGTKPVLPYDDSGSVPWYFWFYEIISSGKYKVMFNGSEEVLYNSDNLNYTGNSGSTGENGGSNGDSSEIDATTIVSAINALTAAFIGFHNWLKGKFGG